MQKSIYPGRKIGIEGRCWRKEEARMAFRRDATRRIPIMEKQPLVFDKEVQIVFKSIGYVF